MTPLLILWRRELALAWSGGGGPLLACGFFLCLTVLVPLAAGGDPAGLQPVAGGIAWLALALSSILSLERLFERDHEDGALDLIALGPIPLELAVLAKAG
ncbi:MAG TPA: heme exporter protein CcmB, partial [Brevundimonas sp.]|nr:heme exporter protein CcmB [Brevundimonas sp.]